MKSNNHKAVLTGKLFAIDALVSLGANVNAADGELRTPLQVAIEHHQASAAAALRDLGAELLGRGLHWSTFQLNLSAFCRIGVHQGVCQGAFGRCYGVSRSIRGCPGCILCQKWLRLS